MKELIRVNHIVFIRDPDDNVIEFIAYDGIDHLR
jgi:hypothetical protein